MQLSPSFTRAEFEHSQTATRLGLDNRIPGSLLANAQRLAQTVLQPLRDALGKPVMISSGYRSRLLNAAVRGARESDHMDARAADITVSGMPARNVCRAIVDLGLPVDQVILEFGAWCHVSIPRDGAHPRREMLTAVRNPDGGAAYFQGIA